LRLRAHVARGWPASGLAADIRNAAVAADGHHGRRTRAALILLLAGCAVGLLTPPRRLADASTYVLMADSLWVDADLTYAPDDLARARALNFDDFPAGLYLTKQASAYTYGKPVLYALAATPFYALFGVRGFLVLNGVLLAALVLLGASIVAQRLDWPKAVATAAVVIGFSVTPAYLHWIDPFLLFSVLAAGAVATYRRGWPAWSGALVAALASARAPYLALAVAPVALYALGRHWRALLHCAVAALAVGALLLAITRLASGQWSPYTGERFYYGFELPYDGGLEQVHVGAPAAMDPAALRWPGMDELARGNLYFFFGRFAGAFVYFPTLLVCALWARRWDREKILWLAAVLLTCELIQVAMPHNTMGGGHTFGNRLFVLLPVALICIDFLAWRPWRVALSAVLLLFAVPLLQAPLYYSLCPGCQMAQLPYRYLPFEWTQARHVMYPAQYPGMAALTTNQYGWEDDGVWTRGGATAEFVFVRYVGDAPRVRLSSRLPSAQVSDGGAPLELSWRPDEDIEITLTHPLAELVAVPGAATTMQVYSLTVTTTAGTLLPAGEDRRGGRLVGVFVQPQPPATPR
jgi:hypothetical protein